MLIIITNTMRFLVLFLCYFGAVQAQVLQIESSSSVIQTNVPITWGQVFLPGQIPNISGGQLVSATLDGQPVTLQVDAKVSHKDGSVLHAILSTVVPELTGSSIQNIILNPDSEPAVGNPLSTSELLATGFDAIVNINANGMIYSASARELLIQAGETPVTWLAGPVVTEWQVAGPLLGIGEHPHLTARFDIRAYAGMQKVRVDVIVENTWTYQPNPKNYQYDLDIVIGNSSKFSQVALSHYRQARFRKTFWWGTDKPAFNLNHSRSHLMSSKTLPNYDPQLSIPESVLESRELIWNSTGQDLMDSGFAEKYMPSTGGRWDIGPLPGWTVMYLLSMDPRARTWMMQTANLAGSWGIHYRDKNTDRPISLADYPYMTISGDFASTLNPNTGLYEAFPSCATDCGSGSDLNPDDSHQPSFAYVPYLLTGDHYFLEELMFWTQWNLFQSNPYYREFGKGLFNRGQVRGQAWSMRTLGNTALITPDDHPDKVYFQQRLSDNLNWYITRYPNNTSANQLGVSVSGYALSYAEGRAIAPWQDDFFTWAIGHLVDLGFTQAQPLRDWKAAFPIGRMIAADTCWIFGSPYYLVIRDSDQSPIYTNFAEALNATYNASITNLPCAGAQMATALALGIGEMVGYSSSPEGYPSNMQPALAIAAQSEATGGEQAWVLFINRSVKPDYSEQPAFAIVPRENSLIVSVNLSANSTTIPAGGTVILTWFSSNADSCIATGSWSGNKGLNGTEVVSPSINNNYILECTGQMGTSNSSIIITVNDLIFSDSFDNPTQLLQEDFSSYSVNADPFDWFDTGADNSMQQVDSLFKTYNLNGNMTYATSNISATNIHSHYIGNQSDIWNNYTYSGRMRIEGANDNIGVTFYSDYPNSDRYYRLRREGNTDFYIAPHGASCTGDTQTGITPVIETWYDFRINVQNEVNSTTIKAKVWPSNTPEPANWQVDCNDNSATRLLNGTIGVWGVVSGSDSGNKLWDDLTVVPIN